jgi:hypothetical protein
MAEATLGQTQPLTAEAFTRMARCWRQTPHLSEVASGEGRVAMELQHLKYRPDAKRLSQMAIPLFLQPDLRPRLSQWCWWSPQPATARRVRR